MALLTSVVFRNFQFDSSATSTYGNNRCLIGMTHSDVFKPQSLNALRDLRFDNVDSRVRFGIGSGSKGSSWMYNFIDWDGTAVGRPGQAFIVGSATTTWFNFDPACLKNSDWNAYVCPKGNREIAAISPVIPGVIYDRYTEDNSAVVVGSISLWGRNVPAGSSMPITKQPLLTGVSGNIGWKMFISSGAPREWRLDLNTVVQGSEIYFATPYPSGTSFSVFGRTCPSCSDRRSFSQASSLQDVWRGDGSNYFFDGRFLYIKLINPRNTRAAFERDGARIYIPNSGNVGSHGSGSWTLSISANCGNCRVDNIDVPTSSWWN